MAKFGVTADLQFDEYNRLSTTHESGLSTRLMDTVSCLSWIIRTSLEEDCLGLIFAGDIFNSRTSIPLPVLYALAEVLDDARGLRLVFLVGNHDSYLRNPSINSLRILQKYGMVVDTPHSLNNFGLIPWTEDHDAFRASVKQFVRQKRDFLFSHMMVEGAVPKGRGGIPLAYLQPTKFKRVFLGDVHEPVEVAKNVRYVGSPMQIDYRDAGGERGFCTFDDVTAEVQFHENVESPRFHLLRTPEDADSVREGDFARIVTTDRANAEKIAQRASERTRWVENEVLETTEVQPRLNIRSQDAQEQVLRRYCEYKGIEEPEPLVKVGMDFLTEARV
jgi:DNA repair exonuclease SbcCD nuclease subunit